MHYLSFIFCFLLYNGAYTQTNEKELLLKHHEFFKQLSSDLSDFNTNEQRIAYLDSVKLGVDHDYLTQRIEVMLANTYRNFNQKKTYDILNKVDTYLKSHPEYDHLKLHFDITMARALYDSGQFEASLKTYLRAEKMADKYEDPHDLWRYDIESKTGLISNYVYLNRNDEAMSLLKELEKKVSPDKKLDEYIYVLNLIGYLHTKSKNYKDGIAYFTEIATLLKDKNAHREAYFGAINNLAYIYQLNDRLPEAIAILEQALEQTKKYEILNRELLLSNNLGFLYLKQNEFLKAEQIGLISHKKSAETFEEIHADAERLLATVYYEKEQLDDAILFAESAENYFRKINDLNRLKYVLNIKNKILIKAERFQDAIQVNSEMISLMDSITLKTDMQNLQKTLVQFESEKKDNAITILKQKEELAAIKISQQRTQILFLILLLCSLCILGIIVFIYQKKINRIQNLALRSKLTRSQFNPHYINNAFTSLQAALTAHNFDEKLINYTTHISRFSRLMLESTFNDEWSLEDEKQMMENYLKTQQYRFQNEFSYTIKNNIDKEQSMQMIIPSAITQTTLENAIEHGHKHEENKISDIDISISMINDMIHIGIQNDVDQSKEQKMSNEKSTKPRGLEITEQRIALHGKIHKKRARFKFNRNKNFAKVEFNLPVIYA